MPNTLGAFPSSRERGTTVVTYVFGDPETSFGAQRRAAQRLAREQLTDEDDSYIGVTGSIPPAMRSTTSSTTTSTRWSSRPCSPSP